MGAVVFKLAPLLGSIVTSRADTALSRVSDVGYGLMSVVADDVFALWPKERHGMV